ncbi:MAG: flavodoxin domain-containing protein [Spirochaetia bacterium]
MNNKKYIIIVSSYHHNNTQKVAQAVGKALKCEVKWTEDISPEELGDYTLIGLGSGIYSDSHHPALLKLAKRMQREGGQRVFLFSTCGTPAFALKDKYLSEYMHKSHGKLGKLLEEKGYQIAGNFMCPGYNTNSFLKLFGGINKARPNTEDLENAQEFAIDIVKDKGEILWKKDPQEY